MGLYKIKITTTSVYEGTIEADSAEEIKEIYENKNNPNDKTMAQLSGTDNTVVDSIQSIVYGENEA